MWLSVNDSGHLTRQQNADDAKPQSWLCELTSLYHVTESFFLPSPPVYIGYESCGKINTRGFQDLCNPWNSILILCSSVLLFLCVFISFLYPYPYPGKKYFCWSLSSTPEIKDIYFKKTHMIKKYFKGNHHPSCYLEVSIYSDISINEHLGRQNPQ